MNLYLVHYAFGHSTYFWANSPSEIKSPSQDHISKVEPLTEVEIDFYVSQFKELNWYRIDLDLWDEFNNQNLPIAEIENYYATFLNLEPYDRVGIQQENPHTLKRIENIKSQIEQLNESCEMVINYHKGTLSFVKKISQPQ